MPQVYLFGGGQADGSAAQKDLLGGKGANLAEMTNLGIPVPPGFTITTEVCMDYLARGYFPKSLKASVGKAMEHIETIMEQRFGDVHNPLLVSVRSGARQSMPGMMETVLNVGLTENTLPGLIAKTQNPRFVYDAYRRLIMMYADVVMEKAEGIEPEEGQGIRQQLEGILQAMKQERGITNDTDLTPEDLQKLVGAFKTRIQEVLGRSFPEDPQEQLWGGIQAVFKSWNGKRAVSYRRIEGIPDKWGTAVNVQAMVFGNMGDRSATGVAFTRNPATGENTFYGEWLVNAQGEDVVAGTRTPNPLNEEGKTPDTERLPSLETFMPKVYRQLVTIRDKLEGHYRDMQDIEFTIQEGRLWMLQTRVGKRNGVAAIRMAADMVREGLITKEEARYGRQLSWQPFLERFTIPLLGEWRNCRMPDEIRRQLVGQELSACMEVVFRGKEAFVVSLLPVSENDLYLNSERIRKKIITLPQTIGYLALVERKYIEKYK